MVSPSDWFRHQIGFARNEVSRRYVDEEPEAYLPEVCRARDSNVKQGSKATAVPHNTIAVSLIRDSNTAAKETYESLLKMGVAPEVARTVLPQGMYTEFIETGSLAAYARLCGLRLDPSAQAEIREYADAVRSLLLEKFPVSWAALTGAEESVASAPYAPSAPSAPASQKQQGYEDLALKAATIHAC